MRSAVIAAFAATLLVAGAFGRDLADDVVREPLEAAGRGEAGAFDFSHSNPVKEIWVTAENQILVELKDDEDTRPNLFDLNGRTLVFTPDGAGGYSRRVRALEWEEEIGEEVRNRADSSSVLLETVVGLESFDFPFAGQRWDSFYLGPPGVVTFGAPFTYSTSFFITMQDVANGFISGPTISALYRPLRYATQHVAHRRDRVVVTWIAEDSFNWPHGVEPEKPARFQAVLGADGSIRFNYIDVPFKDGIAGLFPEEGPLAGIDLSRSESRGSNLHHEVFHFRSNRNRYGVICHLLRTLGDEFDLFVFHTENRTDVIGDATPWAGGGRARFDGCTQGRYKGSWSKPVWIKSTFVFDPSPIYEDNEGFDSGLYLFAHEFGHHWLAYYSFDKSGRRERLYREEPCSCHWRDGLHTHAPFPWRPPLEERYPEFDEETGSHSIMGGYYWVDHGDGSFTSRGSNTRGGFSWLDLYAMGLADAEEVPDMFLLRNLRDNDDPDKKGDYTADKQIFSIDQIVLDEHPWFDGVLGPALSQTVFNAGFVYLLEPGQIPSGDMLELHARYRDEVVKHWSHITGGRSQITTFVPGTGNNRPPTAEGAIPAHTLTENGTVRRVNLAGYFSDPDGDPLAYRAGSTDPDVVAARISGSTMTIQPGAAGPTLLTVTATDGRGGLAYQPIEISVEALPQADPSDFTFVPVILDAPGKGKALFTSELTVAHRGRQRAILDYTYTAHTGGGSGTVRDYLEPGQQLIVPNAVEFLRQRGAPIPEDGKSIGSLRVSFQRTDSSKVGITVRTTTRVPEGRAGLAYPGLPAGEGFDEPVWLCGLRQNEQDRSNVAFQHMGTPRDGSITLRTTVFSGDPEIAEGHRLEDRRLRPGGFYQFSELLKTAGFDNGYARVERVEGNAPFYAYGVINDQANSDGSFVFPVTAGSLEGKRRQTLPVIVETEEFSTELTLTNFSPQDRTLELAFVSDGIGTPDETARFVLTLEAGQQRIIPDVIDAELRRKGIEGIGPSRGGLAGALFATAESGDLSGIVVGARTGSPDGRGGQYGLFYTAVPDGAAFSGDAWIYGLQQNQENRTNLALVNTGEVDDSRSSFSIRIYDQYGVPQRRPVFAHVEARRWRQLNSILATHAPGTTEGYVWIEQFRGNNPFLAYAVVNDGGAPGERSGDGAYLPARK